MRSILRLARYGLAAVPILAGVSLWAAPALAQIAPAGTVIGNQATAVYETPTGQVTVLSNLVETVVAQVVAVDIEPAYDADLPANQAGGPDDALVGPRPISTAGGTVFFPHTVENLGNGPDSFTLTAPDSGTLTNVRILPDADGNGVADSLIPITETPVLNPGEVFGIVIVADVTAAAAGAIGDGNEADDPIIVTATSATPSTPTNPISNAGAFDAVQDDVIVADGPIVVTNKTISPDSGSPGDTLTITLSYENVGNAPGVVRVSDPLPPELTYTVGTALWSDNTLAADFLDEAGDADTTTPGDNDAFSGTGAEIDFVVGLASALGVSDFDAANDRNTVLFEISDVPPGTSGEVTFDVTITPGTPSGTYRNGVYGCVGPDCDPDEPGPEPPFNVDPVFGLTLADSQSTADTPPGGPGLADPYADPAGSLGGALVGNDEDGNTSNDIVNIEDGLSGLNDPGEPFPSGAEIRFEFVLTNDGTVTDTYELTEESHNTTAGTDGRPGAAFGADFPAGTTFRFETSGGAIILDSNGNGIPDVILPVDDPATAEDESARTIVLVADLPADASRTDAEPEWYWNVVATSAGNPDFVNVSVAELGAEVAAAEVDLSNPGSTPDGSAAVGGLPNDDINNFGAPFTTLTVEAGETATFNLLVTNPSIAPDTFVLDFTGTLPTDEDGDGVLGGPTTPPTASEFLSGIGLPAGWGVEFRIGGVSTNNTGVIPGGGGSVAVEAVVTVPSDANPGDVDIWFRALSATGNAFDVKLDRVTVQQNADISIAPDRVGQAAPGGTNVFSHRITNEGNLCVADLPAPVYAPEFATFTEELYFDADNNGILDPTDVLITGGTPVTGVFSLDEMIAAATAGDLADGEFNPGDTFNILSRVQVPAVAVDGLTETATVQITDGVGDVVLCDTAVNGGGDGGGVAGTTNTVAGNPDNNEADEQLTIISGDLEVIKQQALDANCDGVADAGVFQLAQLSADPTNCIIYQITATNTGTADATLVEILDATPAFTTFEAVGFSASNNATPVTPVVPGQGAVGDVTADIGTLTPGSVGTLTFVVEINGNLPNATAGAPTPLQ